MTEQDIQQIKLIIQAEAENQRTYAKITND